MTIYQPHKRKLHVCLTWAEWNVEKSGRVGPYWGKFLRSAPNLVVVLYPFSKLMFRRRKPTNSCRFESKTVRLVLRAAHGRCGARWPSCSKTNPTRRCFSSQLRGKASSSQTRHASSFCLLLTRKHLFTAATITRDTSTLDRDHSHTISIQNLCPPHSMQGVQAQAMSLHRKPW